MFVLCGRRIGSISAPMPITRAEFNSIHIALAVNRVLPETVDRESGAAAMPVAIGVPTPQVRYPPRTNIPTARAVRLAPVIHDGLKCRSLLILTWDPRADPW